jgi:FMN phosphatase YigB (HAD superfamily)
MEAHADGGSIRTTQPPELAAIIFDVDGTLYDQAFVRRRMAAALISAHLSRPGKGLALLRFLKAYRKAQESLRGANLPGTAAQRQLAVACEQSRTDPRTAQAYLDRWFHATPLPYVRAAIRPGLADFLSAAKSHGMKLGVVSDYPATAKLEALGLNGFFAAVVSAGDPGVSGFKPDPSGLLLCAQQLGVSPRQVLYLGDRPEMDAECARRAGATAAILEKTHPSSSREAYLSVPTFAVLQQKLFSAPL